MDVENQFLKIIRNNDLTEIKNFVNSKRIKLEELNIFSNILLYLIKNNISFEVIDFIIKYADQNNILLKINEKDEDGNFPLLQIINNNNFELLKYLVNYSINHNVIINFNNKDNDGNHPLMKAILNNNKEMVKQLFKHSEILNKEMCIKIVLNEFIIASYKNKNSMTNEEINKYVKIFDKIIININEKNNKGSYPLLKSVHKSYTDLVKLQIKYAEFHNITLCIKDKDIKKRYPLVQAIFKNNVEII